MPAAPAAADGAPRAGGVLYKHEGGVGGAHVVLTPSCIPEVANDGDEENPAWIMDVSKSSLSLSLVVMC
jgi:hypothetical protein